MRAKRPPKTPHTHTHQNAKWCKLQTAGLPRQVYLGNLHPNITEEDLMELLRPFGTVTKLVMARNEDVRACVRACVCVGRSRARGLA